MMTLSPNFEEAKSRYHRVLGSLAPYVPQVLSMKAGLRTAIQLSFSDQERFEAERSMIENFCKQSDLYLHIREEHGEPKLLISREKIRGVKFGDKRQLGELFGYPPCCIRAFILLGRPRAPLISEMRTLLAPKGPWEYPMNLFLRTSPFAPYKHLPCSLGCLKTIEYGRRMLESIRAVNPGLVADLVRFNRAPVFYTDVCGAGILFDGSLEGDSIAYRNFYHEYDPRSALALSTYNRPQDCTLFDRIVAALSSGNRLVLDSQRLSILHKATTIHTFDRPEHLVWKLLDFV